MSDPTVRDVLDAVAALVREDGSLEPKRRSPRGSKAHVHNMAWAEFVKMVPNTTQLSDN